MADDGLLRLPSLGADMDEATILEWRVAVGDAVGRGDVVALVDTEKSEIEVESWQEGEVAGLLAEVGDVVDVGTPIVAFVGAEIPEMVTPRAAPRQPVPAPAAAARAPSAAPVTSVPGGAVPAGTGGRRGTRLHPSGVPSPLVRHLAEARRLDPTRIRGTGPGGRVTRHDVDEAPERPVRVSPRARRIAAECGIDLAVVEGTGPDGAVLAADLERARGAASPESAPLRTVSAALTDESPPVPEPRDRAVAMRHAVAALMERSNREIPTYHLAHDVDVGLALAWLEERNGDRPPAERVLPAALLVKATALAAADHPELNGFWRDGAFVSAAGVHVGMAVSLRGGGLVAPAIHDADTLGLDELMDRLKDLVTRTRAGRLRSSEMSDPTITVTNLGDRGPDLVHGVVYPPQVALVGFGRISQRPVVVDGEVVAHPVVTATLAADHRATDGDRGARFLAALAKHLDRPEEL